MIWVIKFNIFLPTKVIYKLINLTSCEVAEILTFYNIKGIFYNFFGGHFFNFKTLILIYGQFFSGRLQTFRRILL